MSDHPMSNVVEAVLLAAGRPVTIEQIQDLFEEHERPPAEDVLARARGPGARYEGTGIELREVASGWRVQVRPAVLPTSCRASGRSGRAATLVRCSRRWR